jgi:hypothetical protein
MMVNDLKRMNVFLLVCIAALFSLNMLLVRDLRATSDRADDLAAQVYSLGSMLGERQSEQRAQMTISEVSALD